MKPFSLAALVVGVVVLSVGLSRVVGHRPAPAPVAPLSAPVTPAPTPLQLILAPAPGVGGTALDREIMRWQGEVRKPGQPESLRLIAIEKLGWLFIAQARAQDDDGAYTLAEQCAFVLIAEQPGSPAAMLLRGHVLQQFHRFKEAEALARQLVAARKLPYDYGLLGDCLMEQGRLEEAIPAYQTMVDLKPGFESFVRAAHMRWLKGDLGGARELMGQVLGMIHPRELDTLAWAEARVALYELQAGDLPAACRHAETALRAKPNDAAAHLVLGRTLSFEGREDEGMEHFRAAARTRPLPEFLWTLADNLEARQLPAEAAPVTQTLRQTGCRSDPRTLALYLATTRQDPADALRLARAELESRQDVFTWDALAWSQFAAGEVAPARESMRHALAEGTRDGRLFMHAAVIAAAAGDEKEKNDFVRRADAVKQMLLPSERRLLDGLAPPGDRRAAR